MLPASTHGHRHGVMLLLIAAVLWSISGVAVKLAEMNPLAFAFYRSLAAAIALAALLPLSRGLRPLNRWMLLSVVVYTIVVSLLITAMTLGTAAKGILLQYTGPVFVAGFGWLFQGRTITRGSLAAIVVAMLGVAIMLLGGDGLDGWIGPLCGLGSGIAFGGLILVLEKVDRVSHGRANSLWIVLVNNAGAALLMLPLCAAAGVLDATPRQYAIVGFIGVVQLGIPYVLFQLALRHVHPIEASLLVLIEPALNPVWVAMLTPERPDLATIVGGCAIVVAMAIEAMRPRPVQGKFAMIEQPPATRSQPQNNDA